MNTKAEQSKGTSGADIGMLVLAVLVLAAGVIGYTYLGNIGAASPLRLVTILVAVVAAVAMAAFTAPGRRVRNFLAESQFEMRKVVWPTRDETIKTTGIIIARGHRAVPAVGADRLHFEDGRARLAAQAGFVRSAR